MSDSSLLDGFKTLWHDGSAQYKGWILNHICVNHPQLLGRFLKLLKVESGIDLAMQFK
jgi:hypothetical protein